MCSRWEEGEEEEKGGEDEGEWDDGGDDGRIEGMREDDERMDSSGGGRVSFFLFCFFPSTLLSLLMSCLSFLCPLSRAPQ